MGFPKQECWSGLPFPTPGDIPDLQPKSPRSPAVAVGFFTTMPPGNQLVIQFSSVQLLSRVLLFATPWTVAHQAPLSMKLSRQEYWSGLPFSSPGVFPTQGSNLCLRHCRQILDDPNHQGSHCTLHGANLKFSLSNFFSG